MNPLIYDALWRVSYEHAVHTLKSTCLQTYTQVKNVEDIFKLDLDDMDDTLKCLTTPTHAPSSAS